QELIAATRDRTLEGPPLPLEQTLRSAPFNYNVNSPRGRDAVNAIIANVNTTGDIGIRFGGIIASRRLNAARNIESIVSQMQHLNMMTDAYPVVLEAIRMIEQGMRADSIRFEDTHPTGDYDIDMGILNKRGGYSMINQVK